MTREESPADIVHVHSVSESVPESFKISVEVNGIPITMELDTGAAVSLVSEATWSEQLHRPKLEPCTLKLQSYPDQSLEILGSCSVQVHVNGTAETLPLVVVAGKGLSLFGRNWLQAIKLDCTHPPHPIHHVRPPSHSHFPPSLNQLPSGFQEHPQSRTTLEVHWRLP